jgi:hypothetical protein
VVPNVCASAPLGAPISSRKRCEILRNYAPPGTITCNTHTTKRINQILGPSSGQAIDMAYTYLRQEKTTGH